MDAIAEGVKSLKDCSLCLAHVFDLGTLLNLGGFEGCHDCVLVLKGFAEGLKVIGLLGDGLTVLAEGGGDILYR